MSQRTLRSGNGINRHLPVAMSAVLAFSTAKCGPEPGMNMGSTSDAGIVQRDSTPQNDSRVTVPDASTSLCNARDLGEVPDFGRRGVRSPLVLTMNSGDFVRVSSTNSGGRSISHTYRLTTLSHSDYLRSVNQTPSGELPAGASPISVAELSVIDSNCRPVFEGSRPVGYTFLTGTPSRTFTTTGSSFAGDQVTFQLRSVTDTGAQFYLMRNATAIGWNPVGTSVSLPMTSAGRAEVSGFDFNYLGRSSFRFGANGSPTVYDVAFANLTKSGMVPDQHSLYILEGETLRYYTLAPSSNGQSQLYRFDVTRGQSQLTVNTRIPME